MMSHLVSEIDSNYPDMAKLALHKAYAVLLGGEDLYSSYYKDKDYKRGFDDLFALAHEMENKTPCGLRFWQVESSPVPLKEDGCYYRAPVWQAITQAVNRIFSTVAHDDVEKAGRCLVTWLRFFHDQGYCRKVSNHQMVSTPERERFLLVLIYAMEAIGPPSLL